MIVNAAAVDHRVVLRHRRHGVAFGHRHLLRFRVDWFGVWGSDFSVWGWGFRVQGAGFRVQGSGFRDQVAFRVEA